MWSIFGVLLSMKNLAIIMECNTNPKTGDYYTNEEINRYFGLPDGVDPLIYLNKMEDEAWHLMCEINPKTGKYYTSDEIAHIIGLLKDCSYV